MPGMPGLQDKIWRVMTGQPTNYEGDPTTFKNLLLSRNIIHPRAYPKFIIIVIDMLREVPTDYIELPSVASIDVVRNSMDAITFDTSILNLINDLKLGLILKQAQLHPPIQMNPINNQYKDIIDQIFKLLPTSLPEVIKNANNK